MRNLTEKEQKLFDLIISKNTSKEEKEKAKGELKKLSDELENSCSISL